MKSKNIEKEIDELNNRFNQLEIKHNRLSKDNTTLTERIHQLEDNNSKQQKKITTLKQNHTHQCIQSLSKDSFQEGDLIKVTNRYKDQYGAIGRVYSITNKQVHFTDIKSGISITRAFHNVKILQLSEKERNNLLR